MLDDVALMRDMTDNERIMFQTEMTGRRKDAGVGILLCLAVGGLGGHRFYMGQTKAGILYLCFFWTFIPAIVSLVELFLMTGRVHEHNAALAAEVAAKVKGLRQEEAVVVRRQEEEQAAAAEREADRAALARLQAIQTADRQAKLRAELEATGLPEADIERICKIQARRDAPAASVQNRQSAGKIGGATGSNMLGHLAGGAVAGAAAGTAVAVVSDLMTDDEGVAASVIEANEALADCR